METMQKLSQEWMEAKATEKDAVEKRRLIEDEIVRLLEINPNDDHSRTFSADAYTIKISWRISRKVDGDLAQEIAAENDMQDYLGFLFRWKPELSKTAWDGVGENVKRVFSRAITVTPGRPSFTISKEK